MFTYSLHTQAETDLYNITENVKQAVRNSGAHAGYCVVYCPHTTAAITISENAGSDVAHDFLHALNEKYPDIAHIPDIPGSSDITGGPDSLDSPDSPELQHGAQSSAAHMKASAVGVSKTIPIQKGKLVLGPQQCVYLCEFDGPRNRLYFVEIV